MLRERVVVTALLLPAAFWIIGTGGWLFAAGVALVLGLASAEYAALFRAQGLRPATRLIVLGVVAFVVGRQVNGFGSGAPLLAGLSLVLMTWHLIDYERGGPRSGTDFAVSLGGAVYLGWIGGYLVSLRALPDGLWWLLTV